jgi:single-stranded-DNA-specific exonuclease
MYDLLRRAADLLRTHRNGDILVVSHIDADGIAAASILSKALDREGIFHRVTCMKLDQLPDVGPADLIIFSDLGSSHLDQLSHLQHVPKIILDHHPPLPYDLPNLVHVNPNRHGFDGSSEISGAGVSYLFAKTLNPENRDLSPIAVVGACGDNQNFGKFSGLNRRILKDGASIGLIDYKDDLLLYGRYTRPLFKSLQYFSDPYIPGITGCKYACKTLLETLDIQKEDDRWVTLSELTFEQKRILASELLKRSLESAPPDLKRYLPQMIIGESYSLIKEERTSPLRDCCEFSTCLNASGRRGKSEIGIEVAKGNRGIYYDMLLTVLQEHRAAIAGALESLAEREVRIIDPVQVMDASGVPDIVVGTCAQMLLGQNGIDSYQPLMVYTPSDRDQEILKISVRCSQLLLYRKIHMGRAIQKAARKVGGEGGGHAPACGAYIPEENLQYFTETFATLMKRQTQKK